LTSAFVENYARASCFELMARIPPVPDADLILAVTEIAKVITSICSWRVFESMIMPKIPQGEEGFPEALHMVMRSAIMDTVLLNVRCLDEFLKPGGRKDRKDDVRASDFSGCDVDSFLSQPERDSINKYLVHITTARGRNPSQHWEMDELARRALEKGSEFLESVGKHSGLSLNTMIERHRLMAMNLAKKVIGMIDDLPSFDIKNTTK